MIGLKIEIQKRKKGKKSSVDEKMSIRYISKLLGKTYVAISKKIERKSFTIVEQWAIFKSIIPQEQQTLELLEYLFTEQN